MCAPILEEGVGAEGVGLVPELDEELLPHPSIGGFKFTLTDFVEGQGTVALGEVLRNQSYLVPAKLLSLLAERRLCSARRT